MQDTLLHMGDIRKYKISSTFACSSYLVVEIFNILNLLTFYVHNTNLVITSGHIWTVHCSLDGEKMGRGRGIEGKDSRR